jgi:hypothetical protein
MYYASASYLHVCIDDFTGDTVTIEKASANISSPSTYSYGGASWIVRESDTTAILVMRGSSSSSTSYHTFRTSYDGSSVSVSSLGSFSSSTLISTGFTPAIAGGYLLMVHQGTYGAVLPVKLSDLSVGTATITLGAPVNDGKISVVDGRVFVIGTGSNYSGIAELSVSDSGVITVLHNTTYNSNAKTGASDLTGIAACGNAVVDTDSGKATLILPSLRMLGSGNNSEHCPQIEFSLSDCQLANSTCYSNGMAGPAIATYLSDVPKVVPPFGTPDKYVAVFSSNYIALVNLSEQLISTVAKANGSRAYQGTPNYYKLVSPYYAWVNGDDTRLAIYTETNGTDLFSLVLGS